MLDVFEGLKSYISTGGQAAKPDVDGIVCRLHYRVTTVGLLVSCVLVTAIEYVGLGTRISCVQEGHPDNWPIPKDIMNTYCFVMSTFVVPPRHQSAGDSGDGIQLFPGVGPHRPGDEVAYKAYYQWIPFVLFLQSCLFYLPHYVFKQWEAGKVQGIIANLHRPELLVQADGRRHHQRALATYFVRTQNTHTWWAIKVYLANLLFLANVIMNMYLMDIFLDREFSTLGLQVTSYIQDDQTLRADPLSRVFPRMTKCTYHSYGPSGSKNTYDALCLLPVNVINEKIYVCLWFWLVVLALVTAISLLVQVIFMAFPAILSVYIKWKSRYDITAVKAVGDLATDLTLGDWKLLYMLAYNMPSVVLAEFLEELVIQVRSNCQNMQAIDEDSRNENLAKPLITA